MGCIACGREIGVFSGTKLRNGMVCRDCARKLPSLLLQRRRGVEEYELKNAIRKTAENLARFEATASYGALHIDEIHGLFCMSKSLTGAGKPVLGCNVFSAYDLLEVGLTCGSPREVKGVVYVDVELKCSLADPEFSFTETVKRRCRCKSKQIDKKNVSWEEPADLVMFRALFNQMLTGTWDKVNAVLTGKTVRAFEIEKARALFMLPEGYSQENVELAYSRLKRVYEAVGDGQEMEIINKYYWFLQCNVAFKSR